MKKLLTLVLGGLLITSTTTFAQSRRKEKEVTFIEGRNYFANSEYSAKDIAIRSQKEFDKLFSPAAVMGMGGSPTEIDLKNQMVIPFILPETNNPTEISVQSVLKHNGKLLVNFIVKLGAEQNYSIKPASFIVVDKARYKAIEIRATYTFAR